MFRGLNNSGVLSAFQQAGDREFRLRDAALLDRVALSEEETRAPEAATRTALVAVRPAKRFTAYECAPSEPPLRGAELATAADHREYVREQDHAWSPDRLR
ncbi:hypothetical protein [Streptomyces hirsutus]|uniref:hypothetical protein n=1 Tax=Streptomyces hirsutus TaxID=35620 RepID=UPI00368E02A7